MLQYSYLHPMSRLSNRSGCRMKVEDEEQKDIVTTPEIDAFGTDRPFYGWDYHPSLLASDKKNIPVSAR